jgi:MATE family multidrug resistance protein
MQTQHLTRGSYREVWVLAYPAMVGMISTTIMWFVDTVLVGHLGKTELAAVGLGGIVVWTLYSFFNGVVTTVSTFVAQRHGSGEPGKCSRMAWQGIYIALLAGVAILIVSRFVGDILAVLKPSDAVQAVGARYMQIRMLAGGFVILHISIASFFRGIGNTKTPMKVLVFANCVNIVLDLLLIFGLLGFPRLEVAGAALATAISNFAAAIVFLFIFLSHKYKQEFETRLNWRPYTPDLARLLKVGVPVGVQFFLDMASWSVFTAIVGRLGEAELAVNSIVIHVLSFSFMPCYGLSIAATTLVGRYIGAGDLGSSVRSGYTAVRLGVYYGLGLLAIFLVFPEQIVRLFNSDPEVITKGTRIIYLAAFFQVFDALQMIFQGALRGAGDTRGPMIISICYSWFLYLPLAYFLANTLEKGLLGAWIGATVFVFALAATFWVRFALGGWKEIKL